MSKIFVWMFGFVSGIIGGIFVLAACMVERPSYYMHILEHLDSNMDR